MTFSIITPAFGQLEWLRLCVASVADQVGAKSAIVNSLLNIDNSEGDGAEGVNRQQTSDWRVGVEGQRSEIEGAEQSAISNQQSSIASPLRVEHIIQDGGSPGIEEFAREMGAEFYRGGELIFGTRPSPLDPRPYRLAIYSEPDTGMYDAINKGIARMSGDLWAWLNCDEQYLPGTLRYAAEWFASHPKTDILCGDALLTDAKGKAISYRRIIAPKWHHTRLVHLASLSCASFYRRSVVARGGSFDTRWRAIGDAEWMARLIKVGLNIEVCGRLLSTFAFTGQNTSESPLATQEGLLWRAASDAPAEWMRKPTTFHHRLRKILAGAYRARSVEYAIHTYGCLGRVNYHSENLGWGWPGVGELKIDDSSLLIEGKSLVAINNQQTSDWREEVGLRSSLEKGERRGRGRVQLTINNLLTIPVLGSPIEVTTYAELSNKLIEYVDGREGVLAVDFANTHVITLRRHDSTFAALTKGIDLTVPDGMPLVWVMNAKGADLKDRVYGPTFTRKFLEGCPAGLSHYLVGGSEECGAKFRERMLALNPSLNFIGGYHERCSVEGVLQDDVVVLEELRAKRPDFIWVGLGTPKQYAWISRMKPMLDHGVLLAVGFAFDVNAGMKQDTPLWMQRLGLGWVHRMASEPKRLLGRYLKWNSLFILYITREFFGGIKIDNSSK